MASGDDRAETRITPAHAGKSIAASFSLTSSKDHPRTRGEKRTLTSPLSGMLGSPPHTRGKVITNRYSRATTGITPAHAGKSQDMATNIVVCRDHPRTRGEKRTLTSPLSGMLGSPPHTRGKVITNRYSRATTGITPAHAGKSQDMATNIVVCRDHPRTRGEKYSFRRLRLTSRGSPPHTRGKATETQVRLLARRITPAHAGKSAEFEPEYMLDWDHPRTRGEKASTPSENHL